MKDNRTPRILNVDDNNAVLYAITRILRQAGFQVQEAGTGRDALRLAEEGPDLILLDVQLPDISGLEVCRQIKANPRTATIPVVHLSTTFVGADDQAAGMEQGADGYLTHPVDPKVLVATLNAFLRLKRVENALRESEEQFRATINASPDGFVIMDLAGKLEMVSPALLAMRGCEREEEMVGHSNLEFFPPEDWDYTKSYVALIQQGKTPGPSEFRVIRVDGSLMDIETNGVLIRGVDGQPASMFFVVRDITERKRGEEKLQESEEKFRQLFTRMPSAVAIYEAVDGGEDFIFKDFNLAAEKIEGIKKDDLIGKRVTHIFPGVKDFGIFAVFQRVWRTGEPEFFPPAIYRDQRDPGTWRESWVYKLASGEVIAIYHDITERKRVERALRESEEKYRRIVDTANEGILVSDETHRTTFINRRMAELLGYTPEELLGGSMEEFTFPEDLADHRQRISNRHQGVGEQYERRLRRRDGSILWTSVSAMPILESGEFRGSIGLFTDISERKQLEERIRQVRGDLLFAVSHDLKSPLMALRQTQEMLGQLPPAEALTRFQEYGEIWRRNLQRLERMINNLVDSQRGEEDRFPILLAPCRLEEMVQRVVEDLAGYALALQVQFDLKLQPVPEGSCDQEALARVVENLLTNAIKFSPKGGRVEVRLGMEGDTLLLEVEDQGLGIPALEQGQLFQPFQRSRSAQQKGIPGTGLGLYVCRRIVEEHGGTITLTSEEGKGTKVIVRLPWKKGIE